MTKRIVVIGLGDAGLLTAIRLPKSYQVIAISSKPCFVSGQELGNRLAHLEEWKALNQHHYDRFRQLDHVRIIHGLVTSVDLNQQHVTIETIDHEQHIEGYDALLIATGTTNGFWRNAKLESQDQLESQLSWQSERFQMAQTIAIVGGGPSAASAASNLKEVYPTKSVHVFFSQDQLLAGYAPRTRTDIETILTRQGVVLHSNHRANLEGVDVHAIGKGTIHWETTANGQPQARPPFSADAILWAVGAVRPNNECLPQELLTEDGFVRVTPQLHHPTFRNVFCVGDICASDPHRSTARNWGYEICATNIDRFLQEKPTKLKSFRAPGVRWGSILGMQPRGFRVYSPTGRAFVLPRWFAKAVLFPMVVQKVIYKGIRKKEKVFDAA